MAASKHIAWYWEDVSRAFFCYLVEAEKARILYPRFFKKNILQNMEKGAVQRPLGKSWTVPVPHGDDFGKGLYCT